MWLAEHFHHCPKCGSAELKRKTNRFECPACGFHFYLNPAAAAAGLILSERRPGEICFIKRAKEPKKGRLALVGGFVDQGESVEEALVREVREELGVEVSELIYHASFANEYVFHNVKYPVADTFFVVHVRQENFKIDEAEVGEVAWRDVRTLDLEELAFTSMQRAVAKYRDGLKSSP
ncbi:MAG: NUDIX domain-containing protein [Verrucomicrobia bacterium]|nr:NUDIX domain-containing protein [Verrucomicrobiota bacterium]